MSRGNLLDFFADFEHLPGNFLVHDDGVRVSSFRYRAVFEQAHRFAARLREAGFGPEAKILFYGENRPEWLMAFWGCLLVGAIVVPVDYRSSPEFLWRVRDIVDARLVLAGDEVTVEKLEGVEIWPLASVTSADRNGFAPVPPVSATRETTAEIIFTSGATAEPKGVVLTHGNILANIVPVEQEVHRYRKYGRPFFPIRFLNLLPLSHMFGQALATFIPAMLPGEVVFVRTLQPAAVARQIRKRRVSVLVCVPKMLEILREFVEREFPETAGAERAEPTHPLRRWWRYRAVHRHFGWKFWAAVVGAAPLPPELEAFWSALGFLVIQGYGLTETAPVVTLNHPFSARKGTVGKPIAGVQIRIADDGEILVRGENVTRGYYKGGPADAFDPEGWFHTGDVGRMDEEGRLQILGRKKEMIVTPEGLNVFPEDVERVLNQVPGVRDSAVIGSDWVHAVLIVDPGADVDDIIRRANEQLADYQRIRTYSLWLHGEFPRTEGTRKLKRGQIAQGVPPPPKPAAKLDPDTPLESLTSLERVELMVQLEADESAVTQARTVGELLPSAKAASAHAPGWEFPGWNRGAAARALRRVFLPGVVLPLTRAFAWLRIEGVEHLRNLEPPVIFASNHQSHMDGPVILAALPARFRYRVAPAMAKEFFHAHFHPGRHSGRERFTNSLNYYLAALVFNAFPIPQREAGARETLHYMGELANEGWCILIFPEGKRTQTGELLPFQPGVGMIASRLSLPVVPVRLEGLDRVLHQDARMATPGRVRVAFGAPLRLNGHDYPALAQEVEAAVRAL